MDVAMSVYADSTFVYREVAIIASRRNGKSEILIPRIKWALDNGRRVIHTAQNRLLPRKVLLRLGQLYPDAKVRYANGQEEIVTRAGGSYMIVAPQRGARGEDADDLIVDELREMEDFDFIAAAEPTLAASENPQLLYLSNAGTEQSVVLNDLRQRAGTDENLAYMEWSADPSLPVDSEEGWLQANPSIGYSNLTLDRLRALYEKYKAAGELAIFETEHLCRWVESMRPRLVTPEYWAMRRGALERPIRPVMAVSCHPSGKQAHAVLAWQQSDGSIGVEVTGTALGNPIDTTAFAVDLLERVEEAGVELVAFDPWTDKHLARHFPTIQPVQGAEFANASERFVRAIETGGIRWQHADAISEELPYASRRATTGTSFMAEADRPERPITAVLAAIRAVWLASAPSQGRATVY